MKEKTWVPGKIGGAVKLDGKNDYIQAPVTLGHDFTVTFWMKTETSIGDMNTSDWNSPVGLFTGAPKTHAAFLAKGKLMFWSSGHGYRKSSSIFVNNDSWFLVLGENGSGGVWREMGLSSAGRFCLQAQTDNQQDCDGEG